MSRWTQPLRQTLAESSHASLNTLAASTTGRDKLPSWAREFDPTWVAELDSGDARKRITATRVLAVGVLALGARKATGQVYVNMHDASGAMVASHEYKAKDAKQAREFVADWNSRRAVGTGLVR